MPQPLPPPLPPKSNFWFILGRQPLLSVAELAAVFGMGKIEGAALKLSLDNFNAAKIIRRLGGTVKIGAELGAGLSEEELLKKIVAELKTVTGKINFGLSFYESPAVIPTEPAGRVEESLDRYDRKGQAISRLHSPLARFARNDNVALIENWGKQIKKILKNEGYSVRYVFKREINLSSVTVDKNGLTGRGREFLITQNQNKFSLAKTLAVQPFEEFGARDFGRPGRDDLSGMLPPKLALMMLNLAKIPPSGTILDPFCGSGTILTEALLLGYKNLIGSDVSEKAIADTEKNAEWTKKNIFISRSLVIPTGVSGANEVEESLDRYDRKGQAISRLHSLLARFARNDNVASNIRLFISDIADLSAKIKPNSVDAIITEPYLGKPLRGRETESELREQAEELKKLYLTAFERFKKVLKKDSVVIFLIPRFKFKNNWITIDLKTEVEKMGFKTEPLLPGHEYLTYARANQLVGREIRKFKRCHSERM